MQRFPKPLLLLLAAVAIVVYGSLYPFRLVPPEDVAPRLARLFTSLTLGRSLGDVLANLLLFFPLGLLAARVDRERSRGSLIVIVVAMGAGLGVALQVGQVFVRHRIPALDDALWNTAGAALGALTERALPAPRRRAEARSSALDFPAVLAASWLAYRLLPFVPALDWQQIKDSLKPLLLHPELGAVDTLRSFAGWLVFSLLWAYLPYRKLRRVPWLAVVPLAMAAEVLVIRNAVTLSNVAGAFGAALAWSALRDRAGRYRAAAACLVLTLVVLALEPFELRDARAAFHWLPFHGFLGGSMLVNVQQLVFKLYSYGSAVWLFERAGWKLARAAALVSGLVLGLELIQTWIPGRTAEATDAILVLIAAGVASSLKQPVRMAGASGAPCAPPTPPTRARPPR